MPPRWRRISSSLAYSALVAVVAALGYLTFQAIGANRGAREADTESAEVPAPPLIDLDSFAIRQERTSETERLNVSFRVRLTSIGGVDCNVYIVARNDRSTPRLWAVWPPQDEGGAITGGGHLRAGAPPMGAPFTLTSDWTRINGSFDHPPGSPPFETVIIYVVGSKGEILLARPFTI